jgi:hypothetical protein
LLAQSSKAINRTTTLSPEGCVSHLRGARADKEASRGLKLTFVQGFNSFLIHFVGLLKMSGEQLEQSLKALPALFTLGP